MRRRTAIGAIVGVFIIAGAGAAAQSPKVGPLEERAPKLAELAPDFALLDLNGRMVRLSDLRGKKAVFLNFWATWCPSCQFEMPTMETVYQQFKDRGLEVLAVSIDRGGKGDVGPFIRKHGLTYAALLDSTTAVMDQYEVKFIPTHFFIDREGRIRHKEVGPRNWKEPTTWTVIEELLRDR